MKIALKIAIEEIGRDLEEEILIRCHELNDEVLQIHRIPSKDIYYYIEAVDNKVFIYCQSQVYESKQKPYEINTV